MAESLGEVFVEVMGDASPFAESISSDLGDAVAGVESDFADALGGVEDIASDAFGAVGGAASDAGEAIADEISEGAETAQQSIEGISMADVAEQIQGNLIGVSLAFAGIGAGAEAFARGQNETNAALGRVSISTGIAEESLRDLAQSMIDSTFSAEDAVAGMERLMRSGILTEEEFAKILPTMDTFSDATGMDMVKSIDTFDKVLSALGVPLTEAEEHIDALGFIATQTEVPLNQLGALMRREAGTLREYGLSTDDIAAAMAALDAEGVKGPRAVMTFQEALAAGEGDIRKFEEALGLSAGQLDRQRDRLGDAAGMMEAYAESNMAARTPAERLQATMGNLAFRFGGLADVAGVVAAPIAGLGPVMMSVQATSGVLGKVLPNLGKALGGAGKAFAMLGKVILANPLFLIGALLIGIAVLVWKFRDDIIDALVSAWEFIKNVTSQFWDWLKDSVSAAVEAVVGFFRNLRDNITQLISRLWQFYRNIWQRMFDFVRNIVQRIRDFVTNGFNALRDRASNAVQSLRDSVRNGLDNVVAFVRDLPARILRGLGNMGRLLFDKGRDMINGLLNGARSLLKNIGKFFVDMVPSWIRGPFERALGISSPSKVFAALGENVIEGFMQGIDAQERPLQRMLGDLGTDIPMNVSPQVNSNLSEISASGVGMQQRAVNVEMNIYNPLPEEPSRTASREIRKLAAIGVFT